MNIWHSIGVIVFDDFSLITARASRGTRRRHVHHGWQGGGARTQNAFQVNGIAKQAEVIPIKNVICEKRGKWRGTGSGSLLDWPRRYHHMISLGWKRKWASCNGSNARGLSENDRKIALLRIKFLFLFQCQERNQPYCKISCCDTEPHLIVVSSFALCRLELPDGAMLWIKVKPNQSVRTCLEPILSRQGLSSNHVITHLVSIANKSYFHCAKG